MRGMIRGPHRWLLRAVASGVLLAVLLAPAAQAQIHRCTHPANTMIVTTPQSVVFIGIINRVLYYRRQPAGSFMIETDQGDPLRTDNGRVVAGPPMGTGSVLDPIRYGCYGIWGIDDFNFEITAAELMYPETTNRSLVPDFWTVEPTRTSRGWWGQYIIPTDIDLGDDLPSDSTNFLTVLQVVEIYGHQIKVDYVIRNTSTTAHSVGLRTAFNTQFGTGTSRDGQPVLLADGTIVDTEALLDAAVATLPEHWTAYDNPTGTAETVLRGYIKGGEVRDSGSAGTSAGPPDRMQFGAWATIGQIVYGWVPLTRSPLAGEELAYSCSWGRMVLEPGRSRRYVTYVGLGGWDHHLTPTYCLEGYAPFNLRANEPQTTPPTEAKLTDGFGNDPFPLMAMVDNFGTRALSNATLTLSLGEGLELDPPGQSRTQSVGRVDRNEAPLPSALWTVTAKTAQPGEVQVRFTGPQSKDIRRKIGIPALPLLRQDFVDDVTGLQMISFPYDFLVRDAEYVLRNLIGPTGSLDSVSFQFVRWDPSLQTYRFFPDPFVTNVQPGEAYWLVNRSRQDIVMRTLENGRMIIPFEQPVEYLALEGWNQVGSPFINTALVRDLVFVASDSLERSFAEAVQSGLILPTLFWYDSQAGTYGWVTDSRVQVLSPYVGYWMLCFDDVLVRFVRPAIFPFGVGDIEAPAPAVASSPQDWRLDLQVGVPGARECTRTIGAAAAAADGADPADIPSPPAAMRNGPRLEAYFPHEEWGKRSGAYFVDVRSGARGPQAWDLLVATDVPNSHVELAWPEINQSLPRNLSLRLEDPETGRAYNMRTTQLARLRTGEQGLSRRLRIVAQPQQPGAGQLVRALAATGTPRGADIAYTLARDSAVDVSITNIAGRPVRALLTGTDQGAGEQRLAWNGMGEGGTRLPNGRYIVRVTARAADDTTSSLVATLNLAR